ncbi:MAG TPA: hypothetical protein VK154_15385 [Chitinophagales bacterium]|nr:hypothetical protein [Chitinophagales bacterium]
MKLVVKKYSYSAKAWLLLAVYAVQVFAFYSLLSNPHDFLTASSFSDYKTNPTQATNCLLLLAKQGEVKQYNVLEGDADVTQPVSDLYTPCILNTSVAIFRLVPRLSEDSYKRYLWVNVFRI